MEPLRVLIVDDEEELVSALVERLNLRGLEAHGVTTGSGALAFLAEQHCDVVLLDVKMPGRGGLELIKQIKADRPDLPVILLTGHGSTKDADQGMRLGAYDYVMKPVKIDDLMRLLVRAGTREGDA